MAPKVSVVIPTYNLKDILLECLESVFKQDYSNLEVIVVDNASVDGTSEAVREKFPNAKLVRNDKNLGVTGGGNAGVKQATGDYIWMVDHDNILEPNMLSEMVQLAESDPKIGIVVPKIYYWEPKDVIWAAGTAINLWTGQNISREGKDVGQYDKVEEVQVAPANFLVKREVIEKVGLYDDVYYISYEDTDFSLRVKRAGYKIIYTPKAVCYHKIPFLDKKAGTRRWLSRAYWTARNKIIFMRKHARSFPLFVLLYPLWLGGYTYQAIRYRDFDALKNFYEGMFDGFKWAFLEYGKSKNRYGRLYSEHYYSEHYYKERYFGLGREERKDYTRILQLLKLQGKDRVLEIGCGLGDLLAKIPSEHKVGVEISNFAVRYCRKRGLSVIKADAEEGLPFGNSAFDVVIMTAVIDYFRSPEFVLKECFRVLVPQGRLVIASPVRSFFVRDLDPAHISEMTTAEMRNLVQECGFDVILHEVCGFSPLYPLLKFFLYRPGRFMKRLLEQIGWGSGEVEHARLVVDRSSSMLLNRWRRSFLGLGQSQLILAEKQGV